MKLAKNLLHQVVWVVAPNLGFQSWIKEYNYLNFRSQHLWLRFQTWDWESSAFLDGIPQTQCLRRKWLPFFHIIAPFTLKPYFWENYLNWVPLTYFSTSLFYFCLSSCVPELDESMPLVLTSILFDKSQIRAGNIDFFRHSLKFRFSKESSATGSIDSVLGFALPAIAVFKEQWNFKWKVRSDKIESGELGSGQLLHIKKRCEWLYRFQRNSLHRVPTSLTSSYFLTVIHAPNNDSVSVPMSSDVRCNLS